VYVLERMSVDGVVSTRSQNYMLISAADCEVRQSKARVERSDGCLWL